jgi:hypothetical protein
MNCKLFRKLVVFRLGGEEDSGRQYVSTPQPAARINVYGKLQRGKLGFEVWQHTTQILNGEASYWISWSKRFGKLLIGQEIQSDAFLRRRA